MKKSEAKKEKDTSLVDQIEERFVHHVGVITQKTEERFKHHTDVIIKKSEEWFEHNIDAFTKKMEKRFEHHVGVIKEDIRDQFKMLQEGRQTDLEINGRRFAKIDRKLDTLHFIMQNQDKGMQKEIYALKKRVNDVTNRT